MFAECEPVVRFCENFGYRAIPAHLHEMLASCAFFLAVYFLVGPVFRAWKPFARLSPAKKAGFAAHVVSEVNTLLLLSLTYPLFFEPELDSLLSMTPRSALACSMFCGYFMFDVFYTFLWYRDNGFVFAIHALTSLFVFLQSMRPFMQRFAAPFIWFEASTSFVNFHWLAQNFPDLVPQKWVTINGVFLIISFFACRVVSGTVHGYLLFREALTTTVPGVPYWAILVVFACYSTLALLNFYWFGLMIAIAVKTLRPQKSDGQEMTGEKSPAVPPPSQAAGSVASDAKGSSQSANSSPHAKEGTNAVRNSAAEVWKNATQAPDASDARRRPRTLRRRKI